MVLGYPTVASRYLRVGLGYLRVRRVKFGNLNCFCTSGVLFWIFEVRFWISEVGVLDSNDIFTMELQGKFSPFSKGKALD